MQIKVLNRGDNASTLYQVYQKLKWHDRLENFWIINLVLRETPKGDNQAWLLGQRRQSFKFETMNLRFGILKSDTPHPSKEQD